MDELDPQESRLVGSEPHQEADPRVSRVCPDGHELFVLSVRQRETRYPEGATPAEREVIDLLLDGNTMAEVSQLRGTSLRTLTTQLAEIYRKSGVRSLRQLAGFAAGMDGPWTE